MRDASFSEAGRIIVPPTTLEVLPSSRTAHTCGTAREASALAMLAAALVKPTRGTVLIGEYDPRVQPAHCKRIAGFVPHEPLPIAFGEFERYIDYRAALWEIDPMRARAHARLLLERIEGMHEAFAFPIVGALIASPAVLVLDRPQETYATLISNAAGPCAIFSTHVTERAGRAYSVEPRETTTA